MSRKSTRTVALASVVFASLCTTTGCGDSKGPVDGSLARAHVAKMVGFGPRPPGSDALAKTADYIKDEIGKAGLEAREQAWNQEVVTYGKKGTIPMRNIWTVIPGKHPERGVLLIGAHYDSKLADGHPNDAHNFRFVAAIDGGGASGVLLELARVIKPKTFAGDIWLAWFDGEESLEWEWDTDSPYNLMGSRHFADTMHADKELFPRGLSKRMKAMVLLDLIGAENIKIDQDHWSSGTLTEVFKEAAESMNEGKRMYRFVSNMTDDHLSFKKWSVPVIDLIDFRWRTPSEAANIDKDPNAPAKGDYSVWWHTRDDDMKNVSAASLAFAGNLVIAALPALEKTYFKQ